MSRACGTIEPGLPVVRHVHGPREEREARHARAREQPAEVREIQRAQAVPDHRHRAARRGVLRAHPSVVRVRGVVELLQLRERERARAPVRRRDGVADGDGLGIAALGDQEARRLAEVEEHEAGARAGVSGRGCAEEQGARTARGTRAR
jgi:hypothetical protein